MSFTAGLRRGADVAPSTFRPEAPQKGRWKAGDLHCGAQGLQALTDDPDRASMKDI